MFSICAFSLREAAARLPLQIGGELSILYQKSRLSAKKSKIRLEFIPELTSTNHDPVKTLGN